jgi:S-formylglutathione hydrolase FrmB
MKKIIAALLVFFAILFFCWNYFLSPKKKKSIVFEPANKECFVEEIFEYCIYKAKQGTNGSVAYHFHGKDNNAHSWNDATYYTAMIQDNWAKKGAKPPTVVSVSFGPFWLLVPKNGGPDSGLLEKFLNEVIPRVEAKTGPPKTRMVFGESMGGVNALFAGLQDNGVFSKVASLCPVIYDANPFVSLSEVKGMVQKTGADYQLMIGVMGLAKKFAANAEEWKAFSPFELVKKVSPLKLKALYLSCGMYDKYGNFGSVQGLAERARARGLQVEWRPLYGGHCAIDVDSLADFLLQ